MLLADVVRLETSPVLRVATKLDIGDQITALDEKQVYAHVSRVWRRHLDRNEIVAVTYIIDRTIGWGKGSFTASHKNILEGTDTYAGIGLKRSVWMTTLTSLEQKGVIRRRRRKDSIQIIPNLRWQGGAEMTIPTPKRIAEKSRNRTCEVQKLDTEYEQWGDVAVPSSVSVPETSDMVGGDREWGSSGEEEKVQPGATLVQADMAGLEERLLGQKLDLATQRQSKAITAMTMTRPKASDIETIWKQSLAESFPEHVHVAWTVKQKGVVNQFAKKWVHGNTITLGEAVDFAVRNWTQIMSVQFHWMTNNPPPRMPSWQFFQRFSDKFVDAIVSEKIEKRFKQGVGSQIERLMMNGKTREEAIYEIARQEAIAATREETEKARREAVARDRAAADKLRRAERLEGLQDRLAEHGLTSVPHPRSEKGRDLIEAERQRQQQERPKSTQQFDLPDVWKRNEQ